MEYYLRTSEIFLFNVVEIDTLYVVLCGMPNQRHNPYLYIIVILGIICAQPGYLKLH